MGGWVVGMSGGWIGGWKDERVGLWMDKRASSPNIHLVAPVGGWTLP